MIGYTKRESIKEFLTNLFLEEEDEEIIITTTVTTATGEPPVTITETITEPPTTSPPTTEPPTTTPPTTEPGLVYEGEVAVEGEFGLYDPFGNPVKVNPLEFAAEGQTLSYYEAKVLTAKLYMGSGLDPDTFVLYIRSKVWVHQDGREVIIAPDVPIWRDDLTYMHGDGIDAQTAYKDYDLTDHWYGYYGYYTTPHGKEAYQKVSIAEIYNIAQLPRVAQQFAIIWDGDGTTTTTTPYSPPPETTTPYTPIPQPGVPPPEITTELTFIHESFVECWGYDGNLYSAKEEHKLWIKITEKGDQTFSLSGSAGLFGINPIWFIALGAVLVVFARRRK